MVKNISIFIWCKNCEWQWMNLYLTIFQLNILRFEYFIKSYGNNCDMKCLWKYFHPNLMTFIFLKVCSLWNIFEMKIKGKSQLYIEEHSGEEKKIIFSSINMENSSFHIKFRITRRLCRQKMDDEDVFWVIEHVLLKWKKKSILCWILYFSKEHFQSCKATVSWFRKLFIDIIKKDKNYEQENI